MKKCIIIASSIFILAATGLLITYFHIHGMQDQVEVKETTLAGDPAAAAGTTLQFKVFNKKLLWDIKYEVLSQEKPETHFGRLSLDSYVSDPVIESQGEFWDDLYGGSASTSSIESAIDETAKPIVFDVAKRTKSGETHKETHLLKEYYKYYPANFSVVANGVHISQPDSPKSYFKIPVPEDFQLNISVTKNSRGEISGYDIDSGDDEFETATESTCTDSGCYITLDPPIRSNRNTDFTQEVPLPADMRGIHFVPFLSYGDESKWFKPDLKHARLVYPLPEGVKTLGLRKSIDEKQLYLVTKEKEGVFLSVIEIKSMECRQKLSLPVKRSVPELTVLKEDGDGNILVCFSTGRFYLLTQKGKQLETALTRNLRSIAGMGGARPSDGILSFDYDRGRLAMAFYHLHGTNDGCASYLVLYDKNELQYAGYYVNSLNPENVAMEYAFTPALSYNKDARTQQAVEGISVKLH